MVGGDVRDDARPRSTRSPCPRRTSPPRAVSRTRDVEVGPAEDLPRAARPGPVAGLDHPLVDEDAVGGRRADPPPGPDEDVGRQPGHGALAVRAGDRDDRHPAVGVADPGRRRRPGIGDRRAASGRSRRAVAARQAGSTRRRRRPARSGRAPPRRSCGPARRRSTGTSRSSGPGPTSDGRRRRRGPRRGRPAGGGPSRRTASTGPRPVAARDVRAEPDERVAARARAGRTRSAAGRSRPRP